MKRQRTWKEYRAIDLTLLGLALAVFEFIIVRAANWWFPGQPFTVSLAAAITSIVYMRWGAWGGIHAAEAGLTVRGLTYSPIRGPEGNIEYLGFSEKGGGTSPEFDLRALVDASHGALAE